MTEAVGSGNAETLETVLAKIKTSMPQHTAEQREFSELVGAWYGTLAQVREQSDGHGVTLVVWNGEQNGENSFEDYLKEARPYNGTLHAQHHPDIVEVMQKRRHRDAAIVSDEYGEIVGANVPLPLEPVDMRKAYEILPQYQLADFMGCAADEDLGTRATSALWATKKLSEIAIITLGENTEDGTKGPLRVYYGGDIVHSTDGRKLRWEMTRRPYIPIAGNNTEAQVVLPDIPYCGDGAYQQSAA